ncbi:uncharacterized protein B0I36DRAFT_389249 [Microdochium trichocladiopsis]|uniref:Uncharacterized protein n=1 Tax=Microdochium trichocladiopsis TaxID=1682393 RepID=A0A9P8XRY6_9PEZI|nr:uncharacterized protein B0I36DRAFT_389249 [Microdochium trichocladiopsis]KAH7014319.1 hypothetical protein B0I36DRAFT_389249 [Microdochium trichocladiopsis]
MALHDVILGLDLGSTSLRAYLHYPDKDIGHCVENRASINNTLRFQRGDFSSKGHPFDQSRSSTQVLPIYLGNESDSDRRAVSLKFAFYIFADAGADQLQHYYAVRPLLPRKHDARFRSRLWRGLHELFGKVRDRVHEVCQAKRFRLASIAITVPVQWTLDLADTYRALVSQVFEHEKDQISCITETEAAAHYLFKESLPELLARRSLNKNDLVLFLDFGGHTMNSCAFHVEHDSQHDPVFYQAVKPSGAGGGSEHWEYLVGEACATLVAEDAAAWDARTLSTKDRQAILNSFHQQIDLCGPGSNKGFYFRANEKDMRRFHLSSAVIDDCFEKALAGPLRRAEKDMIKVAARYSHDVLVVVTGGTSQHHAVQDRIRQMCAKHDIEREPVFADSLEIAYSSAKIAKGATFALSSSQSVKQFLENGAAIGLQTLQDGSKKNTLWDDIAPFLMSKDRQDFKYEFSTNGADEFRLICDPFFERHSFGGKFLHHSKTYDLADLGKLAAGRWAITLSLATTEPTGEVLLRVQAVHKRVAHWSTGKAISRKHRDIPLYYSTGANSVLLRSEDMGEAALCTTFGNGRTEAATRSPFWSDWDSLVITTPPAAASADWLAESHSLSSISVETIDDIACGSSVGDCSPVITSSRKVRMQNRVVKPSRRSPGMLARRKAASPSKYVISLGSSPIA